MLKCYYCGSSFDEPNSITEKLGEYWGFPAYDTVYVCPYCGSDSIGEEEEEYVYEA